ncbi:helix-turn-helix domain-containing protein [Paraburkholderia sp. CNPSo 3281]|uniref:helix-turn-helix domain-containing protein n=1 Tax=Paraburkholderia sp. CNPSo 3281 TaxID=2940933 RepID=UPI002814CCC6|nr:helix-turn-helix domain-containing protein [Paraburkholderia sp. CNPSo 3281]
MRHLCMPHGLESAVLPKFEALVVAGRKVRAGEPLYFPGDRFQSLYAVRSGSLKTFVTNREGREQITGLRLPGEALGLDGIASGVHALSAVALEDSTVCTLPYSALKELGRESTAMQERLHQVMGEQMNRESAQMIVLGAPAAESRLASFLLDVSQRNGLRGYSQSEFRLRLTREEMGSYLGITLETVSRSMTRLRKLGLIEVNAKEIRITDIDGLREVSAVVSRKHDRTGH